MTRNYPITISNGRIVPYPQSFSAKATSLLGSFLEQNGSRTMFETCQGTAKNDVSVRHDVDHDLEWAFKFAQWEHGLGIRSTYFILHTAPYWDEELAADFPFCREIQSLGHEVGIHNDAWSEMERRSERGGAIVSANVANGIMLNDVREMKGAGLDVKGVADHGGSHDNSMLWQFCSPADFGLSYEAYQLQRSINCHYISDNRGELRNPLEVVEGKQTVVLVHPEHWMIP